jgi:hypothetical protein
MCHKYICIYAPCIPGGRPGGKCASDASGKILLHEWLNDAEAHEPTQDVDHTLMYVSSTVHHTRVHWLQPFDDWHTVCLMDHRHRNNAHQHMPAPQSHTPPQHTSQFTKTTHTHHGSIHITPPSYNYNGPQTCTTHHTHQHNQNIQQHTTTTIIPFVHACTTTTLTIIICIVLQTPLGESSYDMC